MEVHAGPVSEIIARHAGHPEMALVALQEIQAQSGYIAVEAVNALTKALGVPEGELQSIITFYTELRTTPPAQHRICVCHGDSCAATGADRISETVEAHLGIAPNQTTPDRKYSYEHVYCLGNCALSPSMAIDEQVVGRCRPDTVVQQLERASESPAWHSRQDGSVYPPGDGSHA